MAASDDLAAPMTLDQAAAAPGRKAVMTDDEVRDGERGVAIYRLEVDGYEQLAWGRVALDRLDGLLASWGLEVVDTEVPCGLLWIVGPNGVEVFSADRRELAAIGERATLSDGRIVARGELARVFAFASDDYVLRGVKATLRAGGDVVLVSEISLGAAAGAEGWPVYSRNEYLCDTGWCATLGVALARWAGVAFEDRMP